MSGHSIRPRQSCRCAYCGEPLAFMAFGIAAWRVGSEFVCNEFCADGISCTGPCGTKTAPRGDSPQVVRM